MCSSWRGTSPRRSWTSRPSTPSGADAGSCPCPSQLSFHTEIVTRPKVLVTSHVVPWPEVSGSRIRTAPMIEGLAQVADVDVFVMNIDTERPRALPADVVVERWAGADPVVDRRGLKRFAWLWQGHLPSELAPIDYS